MRSDKVIKNIWFDYIGNILTIIIGFVSKTVFIYTLGKDYLGLSGLFTNVLTMLSLAELGMGSAITFELYKPIAENDNEKIRSIMDFYKQAYKVIGLVIFAIGICLLPFLKYIIRFDSQVKIDYYGIYLLFLLNTVISYLFNAYKATIFVASQRKYVTKKIEYVLTIVQTLLQTAVLFVFKNYFAYLIVGIARSILQNYLVARKADREYPILAASVSRSLGKAERRQIYKNIYALSLYKISGVVVSSTDNIIISAFINTSVLGCYSLYNYLVTTLKTFVAIIFDSFVAAVGDLNATEGQKNKKQIFDIIFFLSFVLYGLIAIGLWQVSSLFITQWAGAEYVLSDRTVILMVASFLISGLENATYIFRTACGLFKEAQYRPLASAAINLVASIVLVKIIGIDGVFLGTIISRLTTYLVIDPQIVFKKVFGMSVAGYYKQYLAYWLLIVAAGAACQVINQTFFQSGWLAVIARTCVCVTVFAGVILVIYRKDIRLTYLWDKTKAVLGKFTRPR